MRSEHEVCTSKELYKLLGEVDHWKMRLAKADDEELEDFWRLRQSMQKAGKIKLRTMIWNECEERFAGFSRAPIVVRLPFFETMNGSKVAETIRGQIDETEWAEFAKNWAKRRLRIVTESQPSVEKILVNVNQPSRIPTKCTCTELLRKIPGLPTTQGHVLFTGREYTGPNAQVLHMCAGNIPRQTDWDAARAWERAHAQLPAVWSGTLEDWKAKLSECYKKVGRPQKGEVPLTRDAYVLRNQLSGLVTGPLDRNKGELCLCCPKLYQKALGAMHTEQTGYTEVETDEKTLMKEWKKEYRRMGWSKYGVFDAKGGLNTPYALFKKKNMGERAVRAKKWQKVRPIAPGTRHPMRALLSRVGRAWYFAVEQMKGDDFTLRTTGDVPSFVREAQQALGGIGTLEVQVKDIEGCFPNMPREAISMALVRVTRAAASQGHASVAVPKHSKSRGCAWKARRGDVEIPLQVMLQVAEWSLESSYVKLEGKILRQVAGIPIGNPISPAMTNASCSWMEQEFNASLSPEDKKWFRAGRYVDDIMLMTAKNEAWDHARFERDFETSIYFPPLKLEDASERNHGNYLEMEWAVVNNQMVHRLKNENQVGEAPQVWRYQHFESHASRAQKRALVSSSLQRVQRMASSADQVVGSAMQKLAEFTRLKYPTGILRSACTYVAATSGNARWLDVRSVLGPI